MELSLYLKNYTTQFVEEQVRIPRIGKINVHQGVFCPSPSRTHSTELVLKNLADLSGKVVFDIGTGSGVLAIVAAKNAAKRVFATDLSASAIENAKENCELQNFSDKVTFSRRDLFPETSVKADVILANLPIIEDCVDKGQTTVIRFLDKVSQFLKENGKIYLTSADFSSTSQKVIQETIRKNRLKFRKITESKFNVNWYLYIIEKQIELEFNESWYQAFVSKSDEKERIIEYIESLISSTRSISCLEIGFGVEPYFAKRLSERVTQYDIIEKRKQEEFILPSNVKMINADWELANLDRRYDVIIASHVVYYFKSKEKAIEKMYQALNPGGKIVLVVNDKISDYGKIKEFFANLIKEKYVFTCDTLTKIAKKYIFSTKEIESTLAFSDLTELFEALRLSFDLYPDQYQKHKSEILEYFRKNVSSKKFTIVQKIFVIEKPIKLNSI